MKLVVGVSHTPWIPERVKSMARLRASLGIEVPPVFYETGGVMLTDAGAVYYFEETERAHNSVWSERLWSRAQKVVSDDGHVVCLQDDNRVSPRFWRALRAMLSAAPEEVIGLHVVHPGAVDAAKDGERFVTTMSCIGVAYILPAALLALFLAWRSRLDADTIYRTSEDNLIDAWCIATRRRVWHPVPTLVSPDLSLASTGGMDDQYMRATSLDWTGYGEADLVDADWWRRGRLESPRHLVFAGIARPGVSRTEHPAGFDGERRR